ncbi:MAG: DUF839 domain-containing protein [Actinobacteria bacterium]|nr:DUF839 domain-containing protein [Actinomycetota bacterium]
MARVGVAGIAVAAAVVALATPSSAKGSETGPMGFTPISGSAYDPAVDLDAPWTVPVGYRQEVVVDEHDLDIYPGQHDWYDMNTVNETGRRAGRYLYSTHEVRGAPGGGSVSVVDLRTGEASVVAQGADWTAVDGIHWTPWRTLLVGEEIEGGRFFEIRLDRRDPTKGTAVERPAVGAMAHEGITMDAKGNVYVVDEFMGGSIYKFVPERPGDLSNGRLYALKVTEPGSSYGTGAFTWALLDGEAAAADARAAADAVGATGYARPEDLEMIGSTLYAAITDADEGETAGRVLAIDLKRREVSEFVAVGTNAPAENHDARVTGFQNPDNLAEGPGRKLWVIEDNSPSDVWVASPDRDRDGDADELFLFASLGDHTAEGTGIYFGKDPRTLFVNVQHSGNGNDKVMAIKKGR